MLDNVGVKGLGKGVLEALSGILYSVLQGVL